MNDVINRKDAIGAILSVEHIAELSDGDAVIRVSAVNYVLRNLPSAQPIDADIQRMQDIEQAMLEKAYECGREDAAQWIPCSERLPESENMYKRPKHRYLCQRSVCGVNQMFVGARLNHPKGLLDDFWDWYGTKFRDEDVIAWMPLPEPYKEDDHD